MKQTTFESLAWANKKKFTRRERFLTEMDAVIPWTRLVLLITPHYAQAGNGTQPMPLAARAAHARRGRANRWPRAASPRSYMPCTVTCAELP